MKNLCLPILTVLFTTLSLSAQYSVSGVSKREDQVPIFNTKVFISNTGGTMLDSVLTNEQGEYFFDDLPSGEYALSATKFDEPLNGITAYDIFLTTMHITGLIPLNSVNKIIAADVNHSGALTAYDLVEYNNLLMGLPPSNSNSFLGWYFFDENYVFNNPANPWATDFPTDFPTGGNNPSLLTVQITDSNIENVNFIGFKIGDLDLDNDPTN